MTIESLMTPNPACCTPETPIADVAQMMVARDCGQIPVVDNVSSRKLLGVVTDRDITTRIVARGHDPQKATAADCMSAPGISVDLNSSFAECCERMESNKIRRLPVVDANGGVCGIVALADVARLANASATVAVVKEVSSAC